MVAVNTSAHNVLNPRMGEGGGKHVEDCAEQAICSTVRHQCISKLHNLVSLSGMYTERDLRHYAEEALSDTQLKAVGKKTPGEMVQALEENLHLFIPETIARVTRAESNFNLEIAGAQTRGWISSESANRWRARLRSEKMYWWQKEAFLLEKFPKYLKNWEKLYEDTQVLKNMVQKNKDIAKIPEVKEALTESFDAVKYPKMRHLVSKALAAATANEDGDGHLYEDAKTILERAAKEKVLAKNKVGTWLERIVKNTVAPEKKAAFVYGKGSTSLEHLIASWTEVKRRYDMVEHRRKKEGTPRGFHFVTTNSFLNWHFSKRLAYVTEAEQRFADIAKEKPILLEIRRELDSQDWESAEHLLQQAKQSSMTEEDRKKIASMENYLREHRPQTEKKQKKQKNPEQAAEENEQIISLLPASLQQLYLNAVREGKFPCLAALMYNRVWCHERGQVLNASKEKKLQKTATEDTRRRLQQENDGKRQLANTDVNAFREPSIRSYAYTGINAPQILHVGPSGHGALLAKINTEDTYLFRYWTTLIPTDVDYATHAYIVKHLHPLMKGNLRAIAAGNATVPKPEKRPSSSGH